ncbi:MAG: YeeE/YedE family protein [Bacteroidetes bacterium]|nr:YeeE/YedE family protein [Bacteroidota bacterium]
MEILTQPWHWSIAGVIIGLTVPALLLLGNKKFGISSSMRHICAACLPAKIPFFTYDWKKEVWNLFFVGGVLLGGTIAAFWLANPEPVVVAEQTQARLLSYGITDYSHLLPSEIFSWDHLFSLKGFVFFVLGGFLVGFGTRWAGGCTSGHSIMGLANLQWPSLVATIMFMAGGFLSANVILPFLLKHL